MAVHNEKEKYFFVPYGSDRGCNSLSTPSIFIKTNQSNSTSTLGGLSVAVTPRLDGCGLDFPTLGLNEGLSEQDLVLFDNQI